MHIIESIPPSARSRGVILALNRLMSGHNSRSQEKGDKERSKHLGWRLFVYTQGYAALLFILTPTRAAFYLQMFL
jgi:hypothetical protein